MKLFFTLTFILGGMVAVSAPFGAPATPHSVEINSDPLDTVPIVTFEDLAMESEQSVKKLQKTFHETMKKIKILVRKKATGLTQRLDTIINETSPQLDQIVVTALMAINKESTFEALAPFIQLAIDDLQSLIGLTAEQIDDLITNESWNEKVGLRSHTLLTRLALSSESCVKTLNDMLYAKTTVYSVTGEKMMALTSQADVTLEGVAEAVAAANFLYVAFLSGPATTHVDNQLQKIMEETTTVGQERVQQLVGQLYEASMEEEAASLVGQTVQDLEALLMQTMTEIKDVASSLKFASSEDVVKLEDILLKLAEQCEVTVQPLLDLVGTLGAPHFKGL